MYRILVVGAGYTGSAIARYFKEKKQVVYGLVRTAQSAAKLEACGVIPIVADITRPETLTQLPQVNFTVLSAAPHEGTEEGYRNIYLRGTLNVLEALQKKSKPLLTVFLSSTSVWKERLGDWLDESVPPDTETEKGRILAAAEDRFLHSGFPAIVFRLSGIYGPGRNRLEKFSSGMWPEPGPDRYMNMIHRDDIVRAMPVLFKKGKEGEIYLGSDDSPALYSEVCRWLSGNIPRSKPLPAFSGPTAGKRFKNSKLKSLNFEFLYPDFRAGYGSFLKEDVQNPPFS